MIRRRSPIDPLQAAIYEVLSSNQSYPVYDGVSSDAVLPYILISDCRFKKVPGKTTDIVEIIVYIEAWSERNGKSEVNEMIDNIIQVMTAWRIDLSASGFNVMDQDIDDDESGETERLKDHFHGFVPITFTIQNTGPA